MSPFFDFEQDFVQSLHCIPMVVRYKLDTCGVKLKLEHWNQFSLAEREQLIHGDCDTPEAVETYRDRLQSRVTHYCGEPAKLLAIDPHPPWFNGDSIPEAVQARCEQETIPLTLSQWVALTPLQRFALIKLSRPSHENSNFIPALREFGLNNGFAG